ncbi:MAG: oligosaccharide flippase family protein [Pirellulales bacterium]|nr:oligosaccharide flippase family protein [Pirellulales bacterium]
MADLTDNREPFAPIAPPRTDTLLDSVLIILALTAVQRLVGFVRAVLFCRWLDAEQLGLWDMTFSFLLLAAPLAVAALPGAFGRYLEHYRQRGQLHAFLRRMAFVCGGLGAAACVLVALLRNWVSLLIFGTPSHANLVAVAAAALAAVIVYNFLVELCVAMRNIRLSSAMQLINGLAFAALGLGLLLGWRCSAESVLLGYGGSCLIAAAAALFLLRGAWPTPPPDPRLSQPAIWSKVAPFAAWVLSVNLLTNLFGVVDRYMIIHFSRESVDGALDMVGNYHASRVAPMLLVSIAAMLAAMVLPHLSRDWEAGRRELVAFRLRLLLKVFGLGLFAGAAAVAVVAPMLFDFAFDGKYPDGLKVLPWTLVYCCWFGTMMVAQNYLYCSEKTRFGGLALLGGLALNVPLNLLLLPRLGLTGAVLATAAANALALFLVCLYNRRLGFRLDDGARLIIVLPMLVCLGPWVSVAALAAVAAEAVWGTRLFTPDEKRRLAERLDDLGARLGLARWAAGR